MAPKGDGSKRNPVRIFSFDTFRTSFSRSSYDQPEHDLGGESKPSIDQFPETHDRGNGEAADQNWTDKELVESSRTTQEFLSSSVPERSVDLRQPTPVNFDRPERREGPYSVSRPRARWQHLREHVIGASTRSTTPPIVPPQSSSTNSHTLLPPPRAQTPKPSRLARLGFRHIVEQARELEVDDTRNFAAELQNICWTIRSGEGHRVKVDSEQTGSSLNFPFMSTSTLSTMGSSSVDNLTFGSNQKSEIRRPQSLQSLALAQHSLPSIRPLHQSLSQHATPSVNRPLPPSSLPLEALVLSTLLMPFTTFETGVHVEDEMWLSVETFDLLTRTWPPTNEVAGIERCLWCCKAALMPSTSRTQILVFLRALLDSSERRYFATKLDTFQTLAQGLFSLLPALSHPSSAATALDDSQALHDVIDKLRSGLCGNPDADSVQSEYNTIRSPKEKFDLLRSALLLDSLSKCLEQCTDDARLWLLQNSLEQNWIGLSGGLHFTPLLAAIHARTLKTLGRALLSSLSVPVDQHISISRAQIITRLLRTKIIPEMDALDYIVSDARILVVKIILALIRNDRSKPATKWSIYIICQWYEGSTMWRSSVEETLRSLIAGSDWTNLLDTLSLLVSVFPDEPRKPLVAFALPLLHDRLVEEPPAYPCNLLTNLLDTIARLYPQVFYKLLFSCATSSKEFTVVNHLCAMVVVSKFLPDFWIRDAEMTAVALMGDISGKKATMSEDSRTMSWTKARLGQCVLLVELIGHLQAARHKKEASPNSDSSLMETFKFALALEARLGILLDAKEQTALITPPSQRLLFCMLFREIRLLTRSLKPATWLSRVILWFIDVHLDDDPEEEEMRTVGQIRGLYAAAHDSLRSPHQRRSTVLLSKTLERSSQLDVSSSGDNVDLAAIFGGKSALLGSLTKGFVGKAMKLYVTMSTLLTSSDYRRLGPHLWEQIRSENDSSLTASVCFLIMQCAEKTPLDLLAIMEVDLQSSNNATKLAALQKISILTNWRFQIMSQHVITDRSHRPFKLARGPLPFVATDIGSSVYVRDEDPNETKDNLPSELRKRLVEIGWDQDDTPVNQQLEWIRTPMSLLPTHQLDHLDSATLEIIPTSPSSPNSNLMTSLGDKVEETTRLLRRNSSTGGPIHSLKRRAIFVPSLTAIFPRLASLVFDANYTVAFAARGIIIDLMRNDPALLVRPILDLFVEDQKDMHSAMSGINAFLHVQRILPSPMSHYLFNHLAGFLKYSSRHSDANTALEDFAHTVTVLAKLATQVSGLSMREIRRAKIEPLLIPSGSLWFPSLAPIGPMFPRGPGSVHDPFDVLAPDLVSVIMIRTSQNLLFLSMLKRNRQDVQLVRKNMSQLVLPSARRPLVAEALELSDFAPNKSHRTEDNTSLTGLSLILSRSYLLLVAQVFRSMPRHLNDRNEFAVFIDGLNKILLAHGDDIGIVSQVMIALMVASTRFRRLFTSGGGYGLFMPAVIKVYAESEGHSGIRLAVEYAINRFFALHKDTFLFQSLDAIAPIVMLPEIEGALLAKNIYNLFSALRRGVLPSTPDPAGIHNANKLQEREALIASTAEEKPQTFLALLRRPQGQDHISIDLPEEYESSRLGIDNFVRLFLTVIAHDLSIVRAERFLRLFRHIAPYLYHASSSARTVLQEGIDALGVVLSRASVKVKPADSPLTQPDSIREGAMHMEVMLDSELLGKSGPPSDILSMRLDYLSLIAAFTRAGGQLSQPSTLRVIDLVRMMLKDSNHVNDAISRFFADFTRHSLLRESAPSVKTVVSFLKDLVPVIGGHMTVVDFTGVFETITSLAYNPMYANEPSFSHVVVTQICTAGLAACELAASENLLLSFPCRSSLIGLLGQAVFLRGANIIPELEKQTASYDFLTGVVFPFVMSLKTGRDLLSDGLRTEDLHRDTLTSAWIRLLWYSMSACGDITRRSERSKSHSRTRSNDSQRFQRPTFIMALQILKIIVVRAEPDLTSYLPGLWARIASFLKPILGDGDATFSTRAHDISPSLSPAASSSTSGHFDPFPLSSAGARGWPSNSTSFSSPRTIDYALWSFLELLCLYRNPLMLQMRILVFEKIVELDQELRHQQGMHTLGSRPVSVFSKPRRRASGLPSPHSSPGLSPSQSFPHDSPFSFDAGYNNPSSSPSHASNHLKITHLGPIPISAFGRALSGGGSTPGMDAVARATKIKSLTLVRATYRRIRTVQHYMGYQLMLPMPQSHEMDADEVFPTAWTRKQALDAIIQETRELMEEFDEANRTVHNGVDVVDPFVA